MSELSEAQAARRQRTLATALLLSAPAPLVTGFAVISSHSTTQLADFIRRNVELVAIFVSWWVFRHLRRHPELADAQRARLERGAGLTTAVAMMVSGLALLLVAASRVSSFEPGGRVIPGLVIAVLGVLTNGFFFTRYTRMTREHYDPVIAAQQQLYRAKTAVDLVVTVALAAVALMPVHPLTRYVDLLGSALVALYLLASGLRTARQQLRGAREAA